MTRVLTGQGLALSGGGYRASLFHPGVTRRLHELGILQQTRRLASRKRLDFWSRRFA